MANNSFLLIPDISGFTEFVNNTEVNHSQHIISELLEAIIDSDELGLTVSEIEGDAILFYKFNDVPKAVDIIDTARKMFLNFHSVIKQYDTHRICQCNACSKAPDLTLKIIAHAGDITFINVKEHQKPYGTEVIKAHKLLKNDIENHEYLLFTKTFFKEIQTQSNLNAWTKFVDGNTNYEEYGGIEYLYAPLTPLLADVKLPEPHKKLPKSKSPSTFKTTINADIITVYEMISNLDFRMNWRSDIKDLRYKSRLNRTGETHVCVLKFGTVNFETISDDRGKETLVYGERMTDKNIPVELSNYFIIKPINKKTTDVQLEIHFRPKNIIGKIVLPIMKMMMLKQLGTSLRDLKKETEDYYSKINT